MNDFVLCNLELLLEQTCCTGISHNQNGTEPELRSKASCLFSQIFWRTCTKLNFIITLADSFSNHA